MSKKKESKKLFSEVQGLYELAEELEFFENDLESSITEIQVKLDILKENIKEMIQEKLGKVDELYDGVAQLYE